jgi:hypothetical protein
MSHDTFILLFRQMVTLTRKRGDYPMEKYLHQHGHSKMAQR